jgi:hypothetical protein
MFGHLKKRVPNHVVAMVVVAKELTYLYFLNQAKV